MISEKISKHLTWFLLALFAVVVSGCFKKDESIPVPDRSGELESFTAEMGEFYHNQIYFDLGTGTFQVNERVVWDIAIRNSSEQPFVVLNYSCRTTGVNTGTTDWNAVTSDTGIVWEADAESGNLDSTVCTDWFNHLNADGWSNVFLINRGYTASGAVRGVRKMAFRVQGDSITVRMAKLDGSDEQLTSWMLEENDYNYTHVSFNDPGGMVEVEPPANEWDLVFSTYIQEFLDQDPPFNYYLVSGVLVNPNQVGVARLDSAEFSLIGLENAAGAQYETHRDVVGYGWKEYIFSTSSYTVFSDQHYLIQDTEGFYYKLRFLDFYNSSGETGFPLIEYQRL